MATIEVFAQGEGKRTVEVLEVPEDGTVRDLLKAAKEKGLQEEDDVVVLAEDAEDVLDVDRPLKEAGIGRHAHVHIHRSRRVDVTVHYNGAAFELSVPPSLRVKQVFRRAVAHFKLSPTDAKEHVLQICGTTEQPEEDTHIGTLATHPDASVCFNLVLKKRVQG